MPRYRLLYTKNKNPTLTSWWNSSLKTNPRLFIFLKNIGTKTGNCTTALQLLCTLAMLIIVPPTAPKSLCSNWHVSHVPPASISYFWRTLLLGTCSVVCTSFCTNWRDTKKTIASYRVIATSHRNTSSSLPLFIIATDSQIALALLTAISTLQVLGPSPHSYNLTNIVVTQALKTGFTVFLILIILLSKFLNYFANICTSCNSSWPLFSTVAAYPLNLVPLNTDAFNHALRRFNSALISILYVILLAHIGFYSRERQKALILSSAFTQQDNYEETKIPSVSNHVASTLQLPQPIRHQSKLTVLSVGNDILCKHS